VSRLSRALAVRPGEGRLVVLMALAFATAEAGRGLGEVATQTLVLGMFGAVALPPLYIGLGLVGLVATLGWGAGSARTSPIRLAPFLLLGLATLLAIGGVAAMAGGIAIPIAWVAVFATGLLLTTVLWTVAGATFHARQAKRLYPLFTGAAIIGAFVGLLAAGPLTRLVGAPALVIGHAVALIVAGGALLRLARQAVAPTRRARNAARPSVRAGAAYVARSPLMRLVALAYLVFAVLLFAMGFPYAREMDRAFPDPADFATAFGTISAVVTVISFLVATLVANRLYARLGVATVAVLLPIAYVVGFGVWLIAFSTVSAIAVVMVRDVVQRGLSNAAWSAFFTVVPAGRRGPVLAFLDGVPGQIGTMLSGILLLVAAAVAPQQLFVIGVVLSLACLLIVLAIRRRYAASLIATLREGLAEQVLEGGPGIAALGRSPGVVTDLRDALGSSRPGERRLAIELLGQIRPRGALDDLAPLVSDEDPAVRRTAVTALAALGTTDALAAVTPALQDADAGVRAEAIQAALALDGTTGGWLDAARTAPLVADPDPTVRAELAVAMCRLGRDAEGRDLAQRLVGSDDVDERVAGLRVASRLGSKVPWEMLHAALGAQDPVVRAAAFEAAGIIRDDDEMTQRLVGALADDAPEVRAVAGRLLASRPAVPAGVLGMLASGSEVAQDAALDALDGNAVTVREQLVVWAVGQVERAARLRAYAVQLEEAPASLLDDDPAASSSAGFLAFLLRRRGAAIEGRLLKAIALLDAPEASGLIRRCLRSVDAETRAQAIEALDALGDGRLSRAVVRLLDSEPEAANAEPGTVSRVALALAEDRDVWVRAMALRTLGAYLGAEQRWVRDRAMADAHPTVRAAVEGVLPAPSEPMPHSRATLDDIDRMLFLRRVPLFSMLAPEDLQRLAATSVERTWAGGEALVREGELGDELVVIVEGGVRVMRDEGYTERLITRYGAGDHIGELAVLRDGAARTATVIADEPGVRGLVVGGEAFKAILRERPDAAMAMLATLAERLSNM
jgi:HEAT repeat protein